MISLSAKNKSGFINGTITKPSVNDPTFAAWQRCNDLIIAYLLRSVDPSIAKSILYYETAEEMWKDLEDRFSQSLGPQLYSLQQRLNDLNQGMNEPVAEWSLTNSYL